MMDDWIMDILKDREKGIIKRARVYISIRETIASICNTLTWKKKKGGDKMTTQLFPVNRNLNK